MSVMFGAAKGSVACLAAIEGPTVVTNAYGEVPAVDGVALWNEDGNRLTVFVVNRDLKEDIRLSVLLHGWKKIGDYRSTTVVGHTMRGRDNNAASHAILDSDGKLIVSMDPLSWHAIELSPS